MTIKKLRVSDLKLGKVGNWKHILFVSSEQYCSLLLVVLKDNFKMLTVNSLD